MICLIFFSIRYHPESEKWGERRTEIPKNLKGDGCLCDQHQSVLYHCSLHQTRMLKAEQLYFGLFLLGFDTSYTDCIYMHM